MLPKWRAALAKVKSGNGNAKILCAPGDSTTYGYGSDGLGVGSYRVKSWPTQLVNLFKGSLAGPGATAEWNNWFGVGNFGQLGAPSDPRLVIGSAWAASFAQSSLGGYPLVATANTNALSFTPTENVDTFVVFYIQTAAAGSFNMNINGGANTLVNVQNAATLMASATLTGVLGANTINITQNAGTISIIGVDAYNSQIPTVRVMNAGWSGSQINDWQIGGLTSAWPKNALKTMAPDLTLIDMTINDWVNQTNPAGYLAAIQGMITTAQLSGDVAIITGNPSQASVVPVAQQKVYVGLCAQAAQAAKIPFIDVFSRFVSWELSNPEGFNYDYLHPNGLGYADIAQAVFNVIGNP